MRIHPRDAPKTAFSTHNGLWEYRRLPMGLKSAGSVFAKAMLCVLDGSVDDGIYNYLDDICVATGSLAKHVEKLQDRKSVV